MPLVSLIQKQFRSSVDLYISTLDWPANSQDYPKRPVKDYDIDSYRSYQIDYDKSHNIFPYLLVTDFRYQLIDRHQLISIDIHFHRLPISSIGQAGFEVGEKSRKKCFVF